MHDVAITHDVYFHIRILIGLVVGLSLTRVLSGVSKLVQHPGRERLYAPHLVWVAVILISAIHFWWWEFELSRISPFRFQLFLFVLFYAFLFYLLASLLFPDDMSDYEGYEDYFLSRRRWFFGLFAATFAVDLMDTLIKGRTRLGELGLEYEIKIVVCIGLCLVAVLTRNRRFHLLFPAIYLVYYLSWILRVFDILG
ncbi:hypothetical protein RCO27_12085 [Sphingosinicella sp. LHD-64]|uniref:hypothetical protein n=1 Tax=Sphingosinicella sp. LHD-64 TaxID=3072139 RepID=UPI00280CD239|nr:hypothetical protein [Sphingosinicella sp. LHD-64]MDQ8756967.1 hypothetical protein [Sphingosinicella sp. LHD-64]